MDCHAQSSIFVNCMSGEIILYEDSRSVLIPGGYSDDYGFYYNEMKDKEHDLRKFKINQAIIDGEKEFLVKHRVSERAV